MLWKAVVQHACQRGGGYQVGQPAESRQGWERSAASQTRLGLTPVARFTPKSTKQRHWGKASKNTTHHIPPKQTSRATQIFQLEPKEGGRKWISVALPPPSPSQAVLTLGKRRRCTKLCRLLLKAWRLASMDVDINDGGAQWQLIPVTWRTPAIDLSINQSLSLTNVINLFNKYACKKPT